MKEDTALKVMIHPIQEEDLPELYPDGCTKGRVEE